MRWLVPWIACTVATWGLVACGGGGGGDSSHDTAPAAIGIVAGNNQTATAGIELPVSLAVAVTSKSGQAVVGAVVTWSVVAGGGAVTPVSATTDSGGVATTRWTLGPAVGANRATATIAGLPAATFEATATSPAPVVRTYEQDDILYLESRLGTDVARVGMRRSWGGAITEASLNGVDYVNNDDPGRQIQVSLWDGNARYDEDAGFWQWNPVEAGDHFYHGSPLLEARLEATSVYTRTQPIHWAPENISDGFGPLPGDALVEKWVAAVPGHHRAFKVHYRITHTGADAHANMLQELPVMYVNPNVPFMVSYQGQSPWTNAALNRWQMTPICCPYFATDEQWGAYVDANDVGIALYTPMQFPFSKGFHAGPTLQFTPACPYNWDPGAVLEFDVYVLVGPVNEMRAAIYNLHRGQPGPGPLPPLGFLSTPQGGTTVAGRVDVSGWAWGLTGLLGVDVYVDGAWAGAAKHGLPLEPWLPGQPSDSGYTYELDTTRYTDGVHEIVARATDHAGHVATFQTMRVTFANCGCAPSGALTSHP